MKFNRGFILARHLASSYLVAAWLVPAWLLAACSGTDSVTGQQPRPARTPIPAPSLTGEAACFYSRQVQNFRILDRSNLIVYAPNDRNAYHVRISPPSQDLLWADSLAFLPSNDRICGYAGDRLIIAGSATERGVAVIAVSRLSPESLESLRDGGAGAATPAAEPQPGRGAEIEGTPAPNPTPDREPAGKAGSTTEK